MKYIMVFKRNCCVPNHYKELTIEDYIGKIETIADQLCCEDGYEDKDGNVDYEKYEHLLSYYFEECQQKSLSLNGLNCGDFILYARPDDFDKYDLPINDR